MSQTTYRVLRYADDADMYVLGDCEAGTGEAAIRKIVKEDGSSLNGRYIAVPLRNWTEIEFETVQRDPIVKATYIGRSARTVAPIPGQTTIEEEIEADVLAAQIEGEEDEERDDHLAEEELGEIDSAEIEEEVQA